MSKAGIVGGKGGKEGGGGYAWRGKQTSQTEPNGLMNAGNELCLSVQ